jgi:hypothetical protein
MGGPSQTRQRAIQTGTRFFAGLSSPVPRQQSVVGLVLYGDLMGDWLVSHFTIFGVQAQNWMLVALALIAVAIVFAWLSDR